jgi:cytochrome c oxidase subunit 2
MAPMAATLANEAAIDNVVAYIKTLPDNRAPATVNGNVKSGEDPYVTCAACHGADGKGIQATNAPRLEGMSDWYLVTQLKNFKRGIRGAHPKDLYGRQMSSMAAMLVDEQATDNVVSYIDTFR